MRILILPRQEDAVNRTVEILQQAIFEKPELVLGLETGGTMLEVYERLVEVVRAEQLDAGALTTFNLDEYIGLAPDQLQSYRTYMDENLFRHLGIPVGQTNIPIGDTEDPHEEANRFEGLIDAAGGLDLQLLGIGSNGHIGFNEPSSSLTSRTRVKTLTASTREANRRFFETDEDVPTLAITMGIGTIMDARCNVLLATGAGKASAVAGLIEGPVTASCPASVLQFHPNTTVVLDRDAAADLKHSEYYQHVHKDGI